MSRPLIDALNKLLAAEGVLANSQLSATQRRALNTFAQQSQSIVQQPQGRGSVYKIVNLSRVELELKTLQPIKADNLAMNLPKRSANLGLYRNSKSRAHQHDCYYVLMKAISSRVIWQKAEGYCLNVSEMTHLAGVASLKIEVTDSWSSLQNVWLVENQELFDNVSWLPPEATGTLIYYAGNIHQVLLAWLAHQQRCHKLILFPDYDGVGLSNYVRLYERVGQHAQFWFMPNWQQKLQVIGGRDLWIKNRPLFDASLIKLRQLGVVGEIWRLVELMQHSALALEQETVFIDI